MTSNYFKVVGHGRKDEFYFFDDRDLSSTADAYALAQQARRTLVQKDGSLQFETVAAFQRPLKRGPWRGVPLIGDPT